LLPAEQAERLLREPVVVEEKVDGANVGVGFDEEGRLLLQSRGAILGTGRSHRQFDPLFGWAAARRDPLFQVLGARLILFGEWLFARHTVLYDALPDYFLAHDLYDRERRLFLDTRARDEVCRHAGVQEVPRLFSGVLGTPEALRRWLGPSRIGHVPAEGLYVRLERDGVLEIRAKLVRPEWVPKDEPHWSRRPVERNRRNLDRSG